MNGKVKFFNKMKGFGFITGDDGKDYFVHQSDIAEGVLLRENDSVSFEPAQSDRGMKAERVNLAEEGESHEDTQDSGAEEQAEEETQEAEEEPQEEEESEAEEEPKEE